MARRHGVANGDILFGPYLYDSINVAYLSPRPMLPLFPRRFFLLLPDRGVPLPPLPSPLLPPPVLVMMPSPPPLLHGPPVVGAVVVVVTLFFTIFTIGYWYNWAAHVQVLNSLTPRLELRDESFSRRQHLLV